MDMYSPRQAPASMTERDRELTAILVRERSRLGRFIRRRVPHREEAEDLLQDVLEELVQAYRLPEPIERAGAWLFRVARNRIIDRFRKSNRRSQDKVDPRLDDSADEYRLDLRLPRADQGPEALYVRSIVLEALQHALEELAASQREVFIQHELEGKSFREMADSSGTPINTLLSRKRAAVLALRARLQPIYDDLEF
jgi:RNA polymerase sigma factor (sigma-70 family)